MNITITEAQPSDLGSMLTIYNDIILHSTAVYYDQPLSPEAFQVWYNQRCQAGYPVLVARCADQIAGFASFTDFRPLPGYRFTVEHSVHLAANFRGKGMGKALMQILLKRASTLGKHVMIGAIDSENYASIRFHEQLGFTALTTLTQVGYKFNRWLDVVYMHRYVDK